MQSGRAVAVSLESVIATLTVADTGEVRGSPLSPVRRRAVSVDSPVVTARVADAGVSAPDAATARSEVSITDLQVRLVGRGDGNGDAPALPPVLTVSIGAVRVASQSSCSTAPVAEVEIASLSVNNVRLAIAGRPGPNARISVTDLPLVAVVLNEQIPASRGNGLTVNAVRIRVADLVDLIVGSTRSEVADCPVDDDRPPPVLEVGSGENGSGELGGGFVRRGRVAIARGRGFPPSTPVEFTFDGPDLPAVDVIAGADGTVRVLVVLPRDAQLGRRTLTATSGDQSATAEFLVLARPAQPPAPPFRDEDADPPRRAD